MSKNNTKLIKEQFLKLRKDILNKASEVHKLCCEHLAEKVITSTQELLSHGIIPSGFSLSPFENVSGIRVILITFDYMELFLPDELMDDTSYLYKKYFDELKIISTDIPYNSDILGEFDELITESGFQSESLYDEEGTFYPFDVSTYWKD